MSNFNGVNVPPSEDRYAALKDLDSMMKKNQFTDDVPKATRPLPLQSSPSSSAWINNNSNRNYINQKKKTIYNYFFYLVISSYNYLFIELNNIWTTNEQTSNVISNPFVGNNNDLWGASLHTINNMQQVDNGICNTANPFRQTQFSDNNGNYFDD